MKEQASKHQITYSQVVSQELHDQSAIFIRIFFHCIQFSNGIIKCLNLSLSLQFKQLTALKYLLGQFASLVWRILDLVMKNREVESQPQTNGVRGSQVFLGHLRSIAVSLVRLLNHFC